jgi:hypothetical protein
MQILQVLWLAYFVVYLLIDYATCGGGQGWVGTRGKWRELKVALNTINPKKQINTIQNPLIVIFLQV